MTAATMVHVLYVPFTGVGLHGGWRGHGWYKHRIEIFKHYTLKSLLNQSNKSFVLWLSFRPEEENNPLTGEIADAIKATGLKFVFTFDGLMYWDDKFTHYTFVTKVRNLLMMLWDCWHYKEWKSPTELWKYTWENKNKSLLTRLTCSLSVVAKVVGNVPWVYLTRIDSDDMFQRETIALLQSWQPAYHRALVFREGYILNTLTGQVAEWNPPTNPPFHTIIFPKGVFLDPQSHRAYYGDFRTHEDIPRVFDSEVVDVKNYMVLFHKKHISTGWESPLPRRMYQQWKYGPRGYLYTVSGRNISTRWRSRTGNVKNFMIGKEFFGEEKQKILQDFGL